MKDVLKDRMLYYRNRADYTLLPKSYVIVMVDGRAFSTKIKKLFKRPFDNIFIDIMNKVAQYVCKEVQGCKFAYVQSDEISFILTDFENENSDPFYGYRLCKLNSIIASLATSKFNQLMYLNNLKNKENIEDVKDMLENSQLYQFDCKSWNVPTFNDVISWILYRQIDCVRNSKEGAAQTYISHKALNNKTSDEQIQLLKELYNIDWYEYSDSEKYGRFIWKIKKEYNDPKYGKYMRSVWEVFPGYDLTNVDNRTKLIESGVIPIK